MRHIETLGRFSSHADYAATKEMRPEVSLRKPASMRDQADRAVKMRPMSSDDYDRVYALWMSCSHMGFNNLDDSREGIELFLRRNPQTCFVAEIGERLAGVILAGNDGRRGYIYHMAVAEAHRRQGVGSRLVRRCLEALQAEGITKVALVAFKSNAAGNAFWEKMGFILRQDLNYRNIALVEMTRIDT